MKLTINDLEHWIQVFTYNDAVLGNGLHMDMTSGNAYPWPPDTGKTLTIKIVDPEIPRAEREVGDQRVTLAEWVQLVIDNKGIKCKQP